jgi:hypothetical protein
MSLSVLLGVVPPRCKSSKRPLAEMVSGASNRAPAFEMRPMPGSMERALDEGLQLSSLAISESETC